MPLDAEARTLICEAKKMQARGLPGYGVNNEAARCGLVRVFMGYTPGGLLRVHEFDSHWVDEDARIITSYAVISGCSHLPSFVCGWKCRRDGGLEWL
jgi:hypothetical protein